MKHNHQFVYVNVGCQGRTLGIFASDTEPERGPAEGGPDMSLELRTVILAGGDELTFA